MFRPFSLAIRREYQYLNPCVTWCTALSYVTGKIQNGSRPLKQIRTVLNNNYFKTVTFQGTYWVGRDSVVSTATRYGRSGDRILMGTGFSALVQTASCTVGTGSLSRA
jgi:hypothetical protein